MSDRPPLSRPARPMVMEALARFETPLIAYATRLSGDAERARDVVQETFLKLCATREGEVEHKLGEWLYTVCRNLALDSRRKESVMNTAGGAGEETSVLARSSGEADGPAGEAERRDSVSRVLGALERLPANQREVLRLKFQHGLSYREIAGVTELSVTNVGFLIHRGLKSLRARLGVAETRGEGTSTAEASGGAR